MKRVVSVWTWLLCVCCMLFGVGSAASQTTMSEMVASGLENNASLFAQRLRVEQEQALVAKASVLPRTQIGIGFSVLPIETREGPVLGKMMIQQQLPWFGVLSKNEAVLVETKGVRGAEYADYRQRFIYMIRMAYANAWYAQQVIAIRNQDIVLTDSYRQIALSRYEQGLGRMVDIVRANIKMQQDTLALVTALSELSQANVRLNFLVQQETLLEADSLELPVLDWTTVITDKQHIQHTKLDVVDAKKREVEASVLAAQASDAPMFNVGLEYSMIDQKQYGITTSGGADAFGVSVGVAVPLLGKPGEVEAQSSKIVLEALGHEKQQLREQIVMELTNIQHEVELNQAALQVTQDVIEQTQLSLRLLKEEYSNSGKDFEQVLELQTVLLEQQLRKQKLLAEQVRLWAEYEYWRGG